MINVKEMFLKLTSKRYPNGKEDEVIDLIPEFTFQKDSVGNYYIIIPKSDGTLSDTMFTCHLDTINRGTVSYGHWDNATGKWINPEPKDEDLSVKHVIKGDFIETDGKSNLGADDKAGMVIMLNLISENIAGLYYFFIGEETGCIGSSNLSRKFKELMEDKTFPIINKCISFDRRGYDSIITKQGGNICCSDDFGTAFSSQLNEYGFWYKNDPTGVYTDSAEFVDIIPECTNVSVGYFSEHTISEKQDIEFLELLSKVLTKINWDNLPIVRSVNNVVYTGKKSKTTTYGYNRNNNTNTNTQRNYNYHDDYEGYAYHGTSGTSGTATKTNDQEEEEDTDNDINFDAWYKEQKEKSSHTPQN